MLEILFYYMIGFAATYATAWLYLFPAVIRGVVSEGKRLNHPLVKARGEERWKFTFVLFVVTFLQWWLMIFSLFTNPAHLEKKMIKKIVRSAQEQR
jgi:hypothetical protein